MTHPENPTPEQAEPAELTETPAEAPADEQAEQAEPVEQAEQADAPAEPTTPSGPTFADLGLSAPVLEAITAIGYETPSPIQAATIPTLLEGRDVVGLAQTGTGKTAAFALPVLSRLEPGGQAPRVLVLSPTRELAIQVAEAFESFASKMPWVRLLPVYGGQAYGPQLSALRRGVQVVVGTPGRVIDHLKKGSLKLGSLKHLILDEADEMLKMGFAEDIEEILADTPAEKQVALFSATMPPRIRRLAQQYLSDPAEIQVKSATTTSQNVAQQYLVIAHARKVDALTRILEVEDFDGLIVFTRTRGDSEQVAEKLRARGYSAAAINGDIQQAQRERTVQALKDGKLDILVATDVAARGLDVERISHVVNYDLPIDTESYVHRIGRTGRAGRSGDAISFVTPREQRLLGSIERTTRQPLEQLKLPTVEDVNVTRLSRFDDAITAALEQTDRIEAFRDIIDHYVRHHDVPNEDVAAALAVVAQGDTPLLLDPADDDLRAFDDRGRGRDRGDRGDRGDRPQRGERPQRDDLVQYRVEVGRHDRVQPGWIVGAIANEGGLSRDDIGRIRIMPSFSLVELPADLDGGVVDKLQRAEVAGRALELKRDTGRAPADRGRGGYDRDRRGGYDRDRGGHDRHGGDRGDRGGWQGERRERREWHDRGRDERGGSRGGWERRDRDDRGARGGWQDGGGWQSAAAGERRRDDRGRDGGHRGKRDGGQGGERKPRW